MDNSHELVARAEDRPPLVRVVDELPEPAGLTGPVDALEDTARRECLERAKLRGERGDDLARHTLNTRLLSRHVDQQELRDRPSFAGLWHRRDGRVAIAFTEDVAAEMRTVRARYPRPYDLVGVQATFTLAELEQVTDRISVSWDVLAQAGVDVSAVGMDLEENRVIVVVTGDPGAAADAIGELGAGPVEAIRIQTGAPIVPTPPLPLDTP
jgi:hypothetical protein